MFVTFVVAASSALLAAPIQPPTIPTPVVAQAPGSAPAPARGVYASPVERPVSAPFDMSAGPYGRGNRGLDYAVRAGDVVRAIGAGTVVFAGPVAGVTWITVLHPDGLRSSSGPMASVVVSKGDRVTAGQEIGTTGPTFHLGVRRGATYIDPAPLFRPRRGPARLVPVPSARRPGGRGESGGRDASGVPEAGLVRLHSFPGAARSAGVRRKVPMASDVRDTRPARIPGRSQERGASDHQPKGIPTSWPQSSP